MITDENQVRLTREFRQVAEAGRDLALKALPFLEEWEGGLAEDFPDSAEEIEEARVDGVSNLTSAQVRMAAGVFTVAQLQGLIAVLEPLCVREPFEE